MFRSNQLTALVSAEWSLCRPPSESIVSVHSFTTRDIVWTIPHSHLSANAKPHLRRFAAQKPWPVRKRFSTHHVRRGRWKQGCRIVGSTLTHGLTQPCPQCTVIHLAGRLTHVAVKRSRGLLTVVCAVDNSTTTWRQRLHASTPDRYGLWCIPATSNSVGVDRGKVQMPTDDLLRIERRRRRRWRFRRNLRRRRRRERQQ